METQAPVYSVLIVDDDAVFARALGRCLTASGWSPTVVGDGGDALRLLGERQFDGMILDLQMRHVDGLGVLDQLQSMTIQPATILLSGHLDVPTTVRAMRAGVVDVLEKPVSSELLDTRLRSAVEERLRTPSSSPPSQSGAARLLGESPALAEVRQQIGSAALHPEDPVLILGEHGTGKGLVATILHDLTSPKAPFVPVDCPSIPEHLLELKLFGSAGTQEDSGSYHGSVLEAVGEGTLHLSEVGCFPTSLQHRLLDVLTRREFGSAGGDSPFRGRVSSTSSQASATTPGFSLREDLYQSLARVLIALPPLRERKEDLSLLARSFLRGFAKRRPDTATVVSDSGVEVLMEYDWPGNIRELRTVIEQAATLCSGEELGPDEIRIALEQRTSQFTTMTPIPPVGSLEGQGIAGDTKLRDFERSVIIRTYEASAKNLSLTARRLGLPRTTVRDKLKRYGVR